SGQRLNAAEVENRVAIEDSAEAEHLLKIGVRRALDDRISVVSSLVASVNFVTHKISAIADPQIAAGRIKAEAEGESESVAPHRAGVVGAGIVVGNRAIEIHAMNLAGRIVAIEILRAEASEPVAMREV